MDLEPAKPWINYGGKLSEGPIWDSESQSLLWTDILLGHLYRHDWKSATTERIYEGPQVGGFTRQTDGNLLLFRENDVAIFHPVAGTTRRVAEFQHDGSTRFNDVIAAPEGGAFAGTIGKTRDSGGLFRIDRDGSITQVASGTGISNGLAFSPALDLLYWVCSTRRRIFAFPYRCDTGALGEPKVIFQGDETDGYPDGLTVDSEGNLYNIRWTAQEHGLVILNPDGKILHRQVIPPRASSSLCFCGPTLTDLAITSAEDTSDPNREADLYRIESMPVAGRVEFLSSVGI
jgi:sugar lactone lactonase YvrE